MTEGTLHDAMILPGATLGVFGSGQLGRMFALAARRMGYRVHTFSPDPDSPTGQVADREVVGDYADARTLRDFLTRLDAVTFEFENVPAQVAEEAQAMGVPVRPGGHVLHVAQNRLREKQTLAEMGLPVTPFRPLTNAEELETAQAGTFPAVLKTASFGYDGKGQVAVDAASDLAAAWAELGQVDAILEERIDFSAEVSLVAARNLRGEFAAYPLIENLHVNHILDFSIAPAPVNAAVAANAQAIGASLFRELDVVGVLCIEFFLTYDGQLLINEIAPRPHNSGHLTIEAALTSQFEQQVRAVCNLPLGDTRLHGPAAMANLLGDLWEGGVPDWPAALRTPGVALHLYGKAAARPGRKMGHLTACAETHAAAVAAVEQARASLAEPVAPAQG